MNKREKTIAICVGAALGLYAFDSVFLSPYLDRLSVAGQRIAQHNDALDDGNQTIRKHVSAVREWRRLTTGKVKADYSDAESQLLTLARDCGQRARLTLQSQKSEKNEKEQGYDRVQLTVSAVGSTEQIGRFLYELQTSDVPVRINDLEITGRADGLRDELALSVKLATIFQAAPAKLAMAARSEATQ